MRHESYLIVHSSLYVMIVKERDEETDCENPQKEYFFFCILKILRSKRTLSKPINFDYFRWTFLHEQVSSKNLNLKSETDLSQNSQRVHK